MSTAADVLAARISPPAIIAGRSPSGNQIPLAGKFQATGKQSALLVHGIYPMRKVFPLTGAALLGLL
jgi:hypothetical protein